jgi:hypothetical protein
MKFLWFGKKKSKVSTEIAAPAPIWVVKNFCIVPAPLGENSETSLDPVVIRSQLAALVTQGSDSEDQARQALAEYLHSAGTAPVSLGNYSFNSAQGHSARSLSNGATLLLGRPEVIARATTPFHSEINQAIAAGADQIFAIDGIAYAAYSLNQELVG